MADIDDFDIDRSIEQAWAEFQARLSEIISMIDDSADLTIGTESASDDPGALPPAQQPAAAPGPLRGGQQRRARRGLSADARTAGHAWSSWAGSRRRSEADRRRPGNFWVELPQDESRPDQRAGRRRAPGRLRRAAPDLPGARPAGGGAAAARPRRSRPRPPSAAADLAVRPERSLGADHARAAGSTWTNWSTPSWRTCSATSRSATPRVTSPSGSGRPCCSCGPPPDGQEVVIFAAVVHDVAGRSRAAEVLNDLNVEARWVKFQLVRDRVFVTVSVLARPFVPAHLRQAVMHPGRRSPTASTTSWPPSSRPDHVQRSRRAALTKANTRMGPQSGAVIVPRTTTRCRSPRGTTRSPGHPRSPGRDRGRGDRLGQDHPAAQDLPGARPPVDRPHPAAADRGPDGRRADRRGAGQPSSVTWSATRSASPARRPGPPGSR